MIEKETYDKYKIFVIIFTLVTFFFSLISETANGYQFLPWIPLVYCLLFLFNSKIHYYSKQHYGMFILNIIMFIRYTVASFFIVLNQDFGRPPYKGITPSTSSCKLAIIYMIIELITIFMIIILFSDKIYKKTSVKEKKEINKKGLKVILPIFLGIGAILALLNFHSFLPDFSTFMNESYTADTQIETNGVLEIIFFSFKMIMMGLCIEMFIKKYNENKKFRYILFSYLTIVIYIILNTSASRINMILPFLFFILLTKNIFGKKGVLLFSGSVIVLIFFVLTITIYKNSWLFTSNNYSLSYFSKVLTSQIQEYTSNIRPIAQGIESSKVYRNSISGTTFVNDFIGSIPIINHFTDETNRSNVYYNAYILNNNGKTTPLIMPLASISASFFSPAFCSVLTAICILLLMIIDRKIIGDDKTFIEKYIFVYILFIFASCIYCNSQIIVGRLVTKALPVFLLLYLHDKIRVVIR